jgi:hypothetical protein
MLRGETRQQGKAEQTKTKPSEIFPSRLVNASFEANKSPKLARPDHLSNFKAEASFPQTPARPHGKRPTQAVTQTLAVTLHSEAQQHGGGYRTAPHTKLKR